MAENVKAVKPFGWADRIGYAMGDFGNDFTFMLSSGFMMKFYTDIMGVNPWTVGSLMMGARFVDAFTDVTMGQIVDHSTPTKHGKFKPWIRRCCGPLGIAAFLIFQSGFADMPMAFKVAWMFFTYLLWGSIFYTSVNIPYGSMASAITAEPAERAQLSTFRTIGATCAALVIHGLTPLLAYEVVNGATVLSGPKMTVMAGIFAVCGIICHMLCFTLVTERVQVPKSNRKIHVGQIIKGIFKNRALVGIIIAAIMLLIGLLGMSGMLPYTLPVYYQSKEVQAFIGSFSNLIAMIICAPIAAKLAAKVGKKELSVTTCAVSVAIWIACYFVRPNVAVVFAVFYIAAYVFLNFFQYVIWAMITDVIDDAEVINGYREDGAIYSVYSFARKLGQAASVGMIGKMMSNIGYTGAVASNPSQYPEVLESIFNVTCIIPIIGLGGVVLALLFVYPLNKKRVDSNVAELKRRRNEAPKPSVQ